MTKSRVGPNTLRDSAYPFSGIIEEWESPDEAVYSEVCRTMGSVIWDVPLLNRCEEKHIRVGQFAGHRFPVQEAGGLSASSTALE